MLPVNSRLHKQGELPPGWSPVSPTGGLERPSRTSSSRTAAAARPSRFVHPAAPLHSTAINFHRPDACTQTTPVCSANGPLQALRTHSSNLAHAAWTGSTRLKFASRVCSAEAFFRAMPLDTATNPWGQRPTATEHAAAKQSLARLMDCNVIRESPHGRQTLPREH